MQPKTYRHKIIHGLSLEHAQAATFNAVTKYAAQYANFVEVDWEEACRASLAIKFPPHVIKGLITITEDAIRMSLLGVPFALRPFAPHAINVIDKEATKRIEQVKRLPLTVAAALEMSK